MTDEEAVLAGELALGLLDGDERAAALRAVIADPAFAREVDRWRDRFAALHDGDRDTVPNAAVEERVMRGIDGDHAAVTDKRWRWIAGFTSVAAAILLVILLTQPIAPLPKPRPSAVPAPLLVAVFNPKEGGAFGTVYDRRTGHIRITGDVTVPSGRDLELWTIGGDGVPRAVGLVPHRTGGSVVVGSRSQITPETVLAVSLEPAGGSPKPTPTGPVIATSKLVAI